MDSKASLNEFISKVKSEGLLTGTHYYVVFGDSTGKEVSLMCDSVNLPGLTNSTTDIRIFGENREVPYMPLYPSMELSFISDRKMIVKQYFEQWSNAVVNKTTRNVGYYSDYTKQLDVIVTDKESKIVYCARVFEAYPKSIQDISFGFENKDIIRVRVSLVFKYWTQIPMDEAGNEISNKLELFTTKKSESGVAALVKDGSAEYLGYATAGSGSGFSNNFSGGAVALGRDFASDTSRSCSASYALLSTAPGGNANTSAFGSGILSLGKSSSDFGAALGGLGEGINNITAPLAALTNATVGIANTLGAINSAASSLGLGAPFAGIQTNLLGIGGKLAVVSNVAGIPGHLGAIGANLSGVGSIFSSLTNSMNSIPGGSQQIADSVSKMGSVYNTRGNDVSGAASQLQSDVTRGKY
jgi:hypothetical protein